MGSSPLTRGTRRTRCGAVHADGLIPACAGNIWSLRRDRNSSAAHPRSRGEHQRAPRLRRPFHGSSPLARGTRFRLSLRTVNERLIPARAGNTTEPPPALPPCWAHPRLRGEHALAQLLGTRKGGSSPLARGTHSIVFELVHHHRLIPARAGNTFVACNWWCELPAHPRSRGEHARHGNYRDELFGSSPLTRGALTMLVWSLALARLIPAHAGSTLVHAEWRKRKPAHPRSRGEHGEWKITHSPKDGSSPLTRGARRVYLRQVDRLRLIPAHAGSTRERTPEGARASAHPRSRGEHLLVRGGGRSRAGSSPLTRGALREHVSKTPLPRLIPAHAGSTWSRTMNSAAITAHPRSRGEHSGFGAVAAVTVGSSPLTRGARQNPR